MNNVEYTLMGVTQILLEKAAAGIGDEYECAQADILARATRECAERLNRAGKRIDAARKAVADA